MYFVHISPISHAGSHIANALFDRFSKIHPNVVLGRPNRFYDTVKRIAALPNHHW